MGVSFGPQVGVRKTDTILCLLSEQAIGAIFDSIAHGSNDVANAVGPFATIYIVFTTGEVGSKSEMDDNKYWIMALGGVGIGGVLEPQLLEGLEALLVARQPLGAPHAAVENPALRRLQYHLHSRSQVRSRTSSAADASARE